MSRSDNSTQTVAFVYSPRYTTKAYGQYAFMHERWKAMPKWKKAARSQAGVKRRTKKVTLARTSMEKCDG